jgi:hypothetical protein
MLGRVQSYPLAASVLRDVVVDELQKEIRPAKPVVPAASIRRYMR